MIEEALAAGVPAGFVAGDEVYGADPILRAGLCTLGVGYVLAIARNQDVQVTDSIRERADHIAAQMSDHQWQRRTCGPGSKRTALLRLGGCGWFCTSQHRRCAWGSRMIGCDRWLAGLEVSRIVRLGRTRREWLAGRRRPDLFWLLPGFLSRDQIVWVGCFHWT
jgi:hypothetical protein